MNENLIYNIFPPEVLVGITDRAQDFSLNSQGNSFSPPQNQYLQQRFDIKAAHIFNIRQVHGAHIVPVSRQTMEKSNFMTEADGVMTNLAGIVLAVRTADCLPVFLYEAKKRCVGLIHAGWRSARQEIAARAIGLMQENYGCRPRDIFAILGPAIRPCCYKVGEEMAQVFPEEIQKKEDAFYLDLPLVAVRQMIREGVLPEHIFDCRTCTCCNDAFFSYRREGDKAGRHLSIISLKS